MFEGRSARRPATRDDLYSAFSDDFKALNGFRPRFAADWDFEQLSDELSKLREALDYNRAAPPTAGEGWALVRE